MTVLAEAPPSVLAVYAHPDDPEVSCGGALAAWARAGSTVHVVVATRGEKGSADPAVDPDELAARRSGEVAAAAEVLGLSGHRGLDIPDGDLDNTPNLRARLVAIVRELRPHTVVCPDPTAVFFGGTYVNHHDHRELGWAVLDAVAPAAASPHYVPDAGPPHQVEQLLLSGTLDPDVWVDVAATLDVKVQAVLCHASQVGDAGDGWIPAFLEERAVEAGRQGGMRLAEGFRRIRLVG